MSYWRYNSEKNIIEEVPDLDSGMTVSAVDIPHGHDGELQPPATRVPGQPDEADPQFRSDTAQRLRNWDEQHKM